jgi:hypothetical protein
VIAVEDVDVIVCAPFQVRFDGRNYIGDEQVTVPQEVAEDWLRNGWAAIKEAKRNG